MRDLLEKNKLVIMQENGTAKASKVCYNADERNAAISLLNAYGFKVDSKFSQGKWLVTGYKTEELQC